MAVRTVIDGTPEPIGIGRLIGIGDRTAEVAFSVVDAWHGRGVGRRLLVALRHRAVDPGFTRIVAHVMVGNRAAQRLLWSVLPEGSATRSGMALEFTAPLPARPAVPSVALAV